MSVKFTEVLRELSDKIAEVYNLELPEEMTDIYIDLVTRADNASKKYWKLVKALATTEKERDELLKKLKREQAIKNTIAKNYELVGNAAMEKINEERCARTQAEDDLERLRGELKEERRLRLDAEYDKEYYAMQLKPVFH